MYKVLLTGFGGFLATALADKLDKYELIKVASKRNFHPETTYNVNLLDREEVNELFRVSQPDICIHCASKIGGIQFNQKYPGQIIYENLLMGLNLIEVSRIYNVKRFINISTICSYPANPPTFPYIEKDVDNGRPSEITLPYGFAKKTIGEVLRAYRRQYNFDSVNIYLTNLYGDGDNFTGENAHLVAAIIQKIDGTPKHGKLQLLGDGLATRELVNVFDACDAIKLCLENYYDNTDEGINVGVGQEILVKDVAELLIKLMGRTDIELSFQGNKCLNGQERRCLNISKLKSLGFRPTVSLEEGLKQTIDYYFTHVKGKINNG